MKKTLFWMLLVVFTVSLAQAQESATQQQIDKLTGQVQDMLDAQAQQGKRIDDLAKQISDLSDKVNTPQVNNSANADDLKALAEKVQEIDQKRQADREMILKQIDKAAKMAAGAPTTHIHSTPNTTPATSGGDAATPSTPQKGYYYVVKDGDYLSTIAKAYRDQGVKVTTSQILKANPGLDANKLYTGKKIFIPDPNAP
jgi:TolA-binding protein